MSNLHLTVLNEGSVYPVLRAATLNLYAGRISEDECNASVGRIVRRLADAEAKRFEETPATEDQLRACIVTVIEHHMAAWRTDGPSLPWIVENAEGHKAKFESELDAWKWLHRTHCYSVHHACKYEGWKIYPVAETERLERFLNEKR